MTTAETVPGAPLPSGPDPADAAPRWLVLLWTWGPAAVPALIGVVTVLFGRASSGDGPWWLLAATLTTLAIGRRLERPVGAWILSLLVVVSSWFVSASGAYLLLVFVPVLPLAAVTAARPPRASLAAAGLTFVALFASSVTDPADYVSVGPLSLQALFVCVLVPGTAVLAAWLIGYALHVRGRYAQALLERARTLERERDSKAARAVAEERTRIARELHDVVSHNVAVMVVQASAADAVWDADPVRARDAVRAVADTGRAAMGELRAMLAAMRGREDEAAGAERRATEGLARLPAVVEQVRAAGVDARLEVAGDVAALPPALDVSLLRVAQEALTNVLRHAHATTATVSVRVADDAVTLTVADDGVGLEGSRGAGDALDPERRGGTGLVGVRERLAVVGGTLEVAPRPGGGTVLRASAPRTGQDGAR
ncbi:sensor histidine kinase [Patulibacter sp. SYSU D01012]|uniref:sensor histidine kinase n=1 Tax=Patulibacter sp. SYSU D01012 TaxID=2817381 RepID=UPI001B311F11